MVRRYRPNNSCQDHVSGALSTVVSLPCANCHADRYRQTYDVLVDLPKGSNADFKGATLQIAWLTLCENGVLRRRLELGLTVAHGILGLQCFWWLYYLLVTVIPQRWHETKGQTRIGHFL